MKMKDITGETYGKWKVLYEDIPRKNGTYWMCQCSCYKKTIRSVCGSSLISGRSNSCGCFRKHNIFIEIGDFYYVISSNNIGFLIDKDDYDKALRYNWYVGDRGYVVSTVKKSKGKGKWKLHRILMDCLEDDVTDKVVDHINGNKLNNTKYNLRLCTQVQNNRNMRLSKNNTSGVSGVYLLQSGKWSARISYNGKKFSLGSFSTFEEAVIVRKEAENKYFGEFRYVGSDR